LSYSGIEILVSQTGADNGGGGAQPTRGAEITPRILP
jgi:hypothetical protein